MQRQPSNSILLGLFAAVIGFGLINWQNLSENNQVKQISLNSQRRPAAIEISQAQPLLTKKSEDQILKFDLQCKDLIAKNKFEVRGQFIQLNGKNCLRSKKTDRVKILNQTNGFEASYFDSGLGNYKTDLIQLSEGENTIQIETESSTGQKTELSLFVTSRRI